MSEKFEEVVLKKLDELSNALKSNGQRIERVEIELKDTREEVGELRQEVTSLGQEVINLGENVGELGKKVINLEKEVGTLGKDVIDLRRRFTVFDFEINRKIDTLFDSDTVNKESIVSLNVKNYNHDTRISNLENKDLSFAKV